jgi:hypothetical protein
MRSTSTQGRNLFSAGRIELHQVGGDYALDQTGGGQRKRAEMLNGTKGICMKILLVFLLLSQSGSVTQSPFDGIWVIDSDSTQLPQTPDQGVGLA